MPKLRASSGLIEKTSTKDLNVISGVTSATSTTVADADRVLLNDNGTMVQVAVTDLAAYFDDEITSMPNLVTTAATTVGALDSGSITSGFGTIDTGSSNITTTGLISGGSLDIDNVLINGTTIGHTDDTDLLTLADGKVTVAGELQATTLDIGGTNITATAAEINLIDGGTSRGTTAIADGDGVLINDDGTMRMTTVQTLAAYLDDEITAMPNVTSVGTLTTLTVDNIIINGTNIGHTSDTDAIAIASNGNVTLSQNLSVTGDFTVSGTTTTVDSTVLTVVDPIIHLQTATGGGALGSDTNKDVGLAMQYHNGSAAKTAFVGFDDDTGKLIFVPDATINSEVVSGTAGTIVANLEGNVTGTLQTAAQGNVTSLGTLTALTVDNVAINGATIGHTDDTDLMTLADGIVTVAGELQATTLDIGGTNITTTAAEINLIDGGTARGTTAVVSGDGILINDGGTMRMTNVDTVSTYFASHSVGGSNIVTTGALNSGSITSGFGNIDNGSSTITTTGLISGGSLDIDDVLINGTTIGHTDDTDLMTVADGVLTIAGELDATSLDISGDADIDGTTNLDAVDIDGAVQIDATVTVGVDDTGHDVKFFGATSGAYMLWDESADDLIIGGAGRVVVPDGQLVLASTAVTSTAAELNIMDGGTSATSTTLVDADRVVVNDAGTMKQVALSDLKTYNESATNVTITRPTAVAGSNAYTISHESADTVLVYRNGVLLDDSDVSTNAGNNTVTFTCVDTSDEVTVQVISALSVSGITTYTPTAVAGSNAYSVPNDTNDIVNVFRNGVLLDPSEVTLSTSNDTATFTSVDTSDKIMIQVLGNITSVTERQAVVKHTPTAVAGSNAYSVNNSSGDLVQVFRNGVLLGAADVTVNASANTVTFTCSDTSDLVEIYVMGSITISDTSSLTTDVRTLTNKKVIQRGAFLQSSTHQALFLGA